MILPLPKLKAFSKCPKYYEFLKDAPEVPKPRRLSVINSIIQRCYAKHTQTGYRVDWRTISGWVDKYVFQDLDVSNPELYDNAKKLTESILVGLNHWYKQCYKTEQYEGFIDITLQQNIDKYTVTATVPLIKISEPPTLVYVDEIVSNAVQMYNDLEVRGLGWLMAKSLKTDLIKVQHLMIGPRGWLEVTDITIDKEANDRTEKYIRQLLMSIDAGINYPSITPMCNACQFKSICHM